MFVGGQLSVSQVALLRAKLHALNVDEARSRSSRHFMVACTLIGAVGV